MMLQTVATTRQLRGRVGFTLHWGGDPAQWDPMHHGVIVTWDRSPTNGQTL